MRASAAWARGVWLPVYRLVSAAAKLFHKHPSSEPKGPAQPQNQLRKAPVRSFGAYGQGQSGGGYVHTFSQPAQNGRPLTAVERSRPQPRSSWQVSEAANAKVLTPAQGTVVTVCLADCEVSFH